MKMVMSGKPCRYCPWPGGPRMIAKGRKTCGGPSCEKACAAAAKAKVKASGVNIPEAQRTTVQVKLRLDVDVAEDLDALAARWGINRSQCVARMVAATKGDA